MYGSAVPHVGHGRSSIDGVAVLSSVVSIVSGTLIDTQASDILIPVKTRTGPQQSKSEDGFEKTHHWGVPFRDRGVAAYGTSHSC